jgi:hypothetical protein
MCNRFNWLLATTADGGMTRVTVASALFPRGLTIEIGTL